MSEPKLVRVRFDRECFGNTFVNVDGHDITQFCRAVTIRAAVGELTTVIVEMFAEVEGEMVADVIPRLMPMTPVMA